LKFSKVIFSNKEYDEGNIESSRKIFYLSEWKFQYPTDMCWSYQGNEVACQSGLLLCSHSKKNKNQKLKIRTGKNLSTVVIHPQPVCYWFRVWYDLTPS
jgi:hypothetical protein